MKRFSPLLLIAFSFTTVLLAQSNSDALNIGIGHEPENHTVTVERLVRYHDSGEYEAQIRQVVNFARDYLENRTHGADKSDKLAAVFDIDETALSNWDVMAECGFCSYGTQVKLHPNPHGPAISPVLELFNFAKTKGIAVFFVTGRHENQRELTVRNLMEVGYSAWSDLVMQPDNNTDPARVFKPRNRRQITGRGYRIILNIGDQASDLAGCCAERVFKLPNPFYQIP